MNSDIQSPPPIHAHVSDSSCSMLGAGLGGKFIIIKKLQTYSVGDIVCFKSFRGSIIHRVTHVKHGYVFTKGDHNKNGDGWIPIEDVEGKLIEILK